MKAFRIIIAILFLTSGKLFAQEEGIQVAIGGEATRTLEKAYRIPETPKILDTVFKVNQTNFPPMVVNYEPTIEIQRIQPATVSMTQKLPQLYHSYARIGVGSVLMPLAEIYYNNIRDRKLNYGGSLQHLSSFGPIRNYAPANFDRTKLNGFINVTERKYSWGSDLNYMTHGFRYYGFQNPDADSDSIKNRFNSIGAKAYFNRHRHDSLGINWTGKLQYNYFQDRQPKEDSLKDWRAREHYIYAGAHAHMRWGDEIFAADIDLQHNDYRYGVDNQAISLIDTAIHHSNTVFSIRPNITTYSKNTRLKAKLGVNLTANFAAKTRVHLYPDMEVKYSLFDDILIPYATLKGGMTQTTFRGLSTQNEFILSNVNLRNENKSIEIAGGLKGTIARRLGFNVMASFGNVKDRALYVIDTLYSNENQFRVQYDTMNVATIEGSLNYQFLEKIKIDLIGRFNSYQPLYNSYAWHLPQVQFIARGNYNIYDKFLVQLDFNLEGGRKALVYAPGDDVTIENGQYIRDLGFIADINLGLEYRYNKRISAFIQFNNLASQRYQRWYNYPVQAFQVMGGVTARF